MLHRLALLLLGLVACARAFLLPAAGRARRAGGVLLTMRALQIEKDEKAVGAALCRILETEYKATLATGKERFCFGISGGSMLKMLANLQQSPEMDMSKCTMVFISHRCVALDDESSTYHKARPLFLDAWMQQGLNVIAPLGSSDAEACAAHQEAEMQMLSRSVLPLDPWGFPIFDLLLIGVGIDGHVGSIYPETAEVNSSKVVVPLQGHKISLSLTAMLAARTQVVACAGKSSKAPLGKAEALVRGLESTTDTPWSFPARALRDTAAWLVDEDSACLLKVKR